MDESVEVHCFLVEVEESGFRGGWWYEIGCGVVRVGVKGVIRGWCQVWES